MFYVTSGGCKRVWKLHRQFWKRDKTSWRPVHHRRVSKRKRIHLFCGCCLREICSQLWQASPSNKDCKPQIGWVKNHHFIRFVVVFFVDDYSRSEWLTLSLLHGALLVPIDLTTPKWVLSHLQTLMLDLLCLLIFQLKISKRSKKEE